ncbi:hypothetical protein yberc0001_7440 [Yersinia bercovieri ATCC 43970]|uniref:Secretin/TonB short N-terminal domain-containing protein n=1 Tax=Yersinia bercovieri ATCC 43970 TaxID=349968 RepID=A0ABM9XX52_YERBE|nr:hypothetical protein yberc0001_7440 [Yersinia bercovieri ATCC 43970]
MIKNKNKYSGIAVLSALALATLMVTQGVKAADLQLNLAAQPLANAIANVAKQGQLHVIFDESELRQLRAPAVSGNYSPQAALQQLLAGSGLELIASGKGVCDSPDAGGRCQWGQHGAANHLGYGRGWWSCRRG